MVHNLPSLNILHFHIINCKDREYAAQYDEKIVPLREVIQNITNDKDYYQNFFFTVVASTLTEDGESRGLQVSCFIITIISVSDTSQRQVCTPLTRCGSR